MTPTIVHSACPSLGALCRCVIVTSALLLSASACGAERDRRSANAPAGGAPAANAPGGSAAQTTGTPDGWPQWRGPNRDGKSSETGLLKEWPESGPALAWKAQGLGKGFSSVAVAGGRIYTMGEVRNESYVHALDSNGKILWSAKVGKPGGGGGYPGTRGTPTVDGDRVYVIGERGEVVCFEAAGGKEVWRRSLTDDFGGDVPHWGYAESPLVDGPRVICTPGGSKGTLVALDKNSGKTLWQSSGWTDEAHYSSAIVAEHGGVRQYIQLTPRSVAGVAADSGKVLWQAARKGQVAVIPTPVFHDGHVYVTSGYGVGCDLFKITPQGGAFRAAKVYSNNVMVNHHGGVVLLDGKVYGHSDNKGWTCQDFLTGKDDWKDKESLGKGSIAYADGRLYLRDEGSGTVVLIDASAQGFKERGRFDQPNRSSANAWPHPVVAGGKLYLRDQDVLLCYDVKAK